MKSMVIISLLLAALSCRHTESSVAKDLNTEAADSSSQASAADESPVSLSDTLSPFKCVIDTLNSAGEPLVSSEYFLYDITGDNNPELWIIQGTCEADELLWVFSADYGKVRKIFSGYGGHTDFYLNGNTLVSNTCNTGGGYISIYRYERGKIKVKSAEFSTWNEEGECRPLRKKDQPIIDFWEKCDTEIPINFLK